MEMRDNEGGGGGRGEVGAVLGEEKQKESLY